MAELEQALLIEETAERQRKQGILVAPPSGIGKTSSHQMITTEAVRNYAAEQGIAKEEALKRGRGAKSKEFVEKGAEVYAKV